jgi:hypothetical protein
VFKDIIRGEINRMFADNAQANQSEKGDREDASKLDGLKFKDGTPIRETIEESSRAMNTVNSKQDLSENKKVPKIDL